MFILLALLVGCPAPKDTGDPSDTDLETGDSTETQETGETGDTEPEGCEADGDGRISWSEFLADPTLGITALYQVNQPGTEVEVPDLAGEDQGDGTFAWDFTAPTDEDDTWSVTIRTLEGTWFADSFPDATYYVGLDASDTTWGIYKVDDAQERLFLLGLASAQEGESLLMYDEPVVVFEFPVADGKSWSSDAVEARGLYEGTEYPADFGLAGTVHLYHTYRFEVDGTGSLSVPMGTFDVLRLRLYQEMSADNSLYGNVDTISQYAYFYLAECTGLVARVRSRDDERSPDFQVATEYLRLGF